MSTPVRRPNVFQSFDGTPNDPVRAKITTISTRSSPSVPPSSQAYEPFVKSVLSQRLVKRIFLCSAAFTLFVTTIWSAWSGEGGMWGFLSNTIKPTTILYAAFLWATGVLPVLIVRKAYLKVPYAHTSSPKGVLATAMPTFRGGLYIYITSALAFTIFHILSANATQSSVQNGLRLFVKSKKHPYYLNGRFLFVLTSQLFYGLMFFLRNIMLNRFFISRKTTTQNPNSSLLVKAITSALAIFVFSVLCSCTHLAIFGFGRSIQLPIMFKIPVLSHFLRPFAAHFLKGSWGLLLLTKQFPLVIETFFLGLIMAATWEFSETIFDLSVAEPISITPTTGEPFVALISGIASPDTHFRHFAYVELNELAAEESPAATTRRTAFFADQKFNPPLWSQLCKEALALLKNDYEHFLRRGQPAPTAPSVPETKKPSGPEAPSTPLIRKQIFKANKESPVRSVIDSLASDGQITQAADAGASQIPEIFRSVESIPSASNAIAEVKKVEEDAINRIGTLRTRLTGGCRKCMPGSVTQSFDRLGLWWSRERLDKVVQGYLWNRETDVLVISVLSQLTCASLTEDRYGVVQRDIPRILETLLGFLSAVEDYRAEVSALDTLSTLSQEEVTLLSLKERSDKERTQEEVIKSLDVLDFMEDSLKEGVVNIVVKFGDSLSAFKFPPRIARKLQSYVEYS